MYIQMFMHCGSSHMNQFYTNIHKQSHKTDSLTDETDAGLFASVVECSILTVNSMG